MGGTVTIIICESFEKVNEKNIELMHDIFRHLQNNIMFYGPGVKFCVSVFRQKSRMALESRADSGLNSLITESHGGQNGMRAGTA